MKASFRILNPRSVEATMTLTLTIGQWEKIADAVDTIKEGGSSHGYWQVAAVVKNMVRLAHGEFSESIEEE